jgi:hypothetical protein
MPFAEDQITVPVARDRPVVGFGRAFADVDRPAELALAVHHRMPQRSTVGSAGAEIAGELFAQSAPGLHKQRQVDGLVRHAHLRVVGELLAQPTRDLLRRPLQLELRLDERTQLVVDGELR